MSSHDLPTCHCGAHAPLLARELDGSFTPVCVVHYAVHETTHPHLAQALSLTLLDDLLESANAS